jgi:hypothetical protein
VDKLAQVLQKEIPRLTSNYFRIHYIVWNLPAKFKEAFAKAVGPNVIQYIPTEDQLQYVIVDIFSTTTGHGSTNVQ